MRFVLPVPPSANRLWRRSGRSIHVSPEYRDWQQAAKWALSEQAARDFRYECDVRVAIDLVGRAGIDLDNAIKPTLDVLQHAGVLANDRQAVLLEVRRRRCDEPGWLQVEVGPMEGAAS